MVKRKDLKKSAKARLTGNWSKLIMFNIVTVLIPLVLRVCSVHVVINMILSLGAIAINYGITKVYLNFAKGEGFTWSNFKCNKSIYLRGYTASILVGVIQFIGYFVNALCILIAIAAAPHSKDFIASLNPQEIIAGNISFEIIAFIIIGGLAGTIISTWIYAMYSMVPYIILEDNPNNDAIISMKYSRRIMRKHKFQLVKLYLSFLGWEILAGAISSGIVITVGNFIGLSIRESIVIGGVLGTCVVLPYINTTAANFYLRLLEVEKEKVSKLGILK